MLGGIFHFCSNFNTTLGEQTVENLIRRRVLRRLIWFLHGLPMPHKKDTWLIWVKSLLLLETSVVDSHIFYLTSMTTVLLETTVLPMHIRQDMIRHENRSGARVQSALSSGGIATVQQARLVDNNKFNTLGSIHYQKHV